MFGSNIDPLAAAIIARSTIERYDDFLVRGSSQAASLVLRAMNQLTVWPLEAPAAD